MQGGHHCSLQNEKVEAKCWRDKYFWQYLQQAAPVTVSYFRTQRRQYHCENSCRFERLRGQPEWAKGVPKAKRHKDGSDSDSSDEEEDSFLQRTGDLLKSSTDQLPKGFLDLKRMKDANSSKRAEAVVRAVEFHPSSSVVLVAGYHKTLDLFQVDGQNNPKLQSIHLQGFPISSAHFSQDGREVVMTTRRKKFFVYDMMAGKITPVHGIRGECILCVCVCV